MSNLLETFEKQQIERLTSKDSNIDNLMYGFRDKAYPLFKQTKNELSVLYGLKPCIETTGDTQGYKCPVTTKEYDRTSRKKKDNGWYIKLKNSQKVTAEPTVSNGLVYFPLLKNLFLLLF